MSNLPTLPDPLLQSLYGYWCSRRHGRPVPERQDIDPLDMPRTLLPHLLLVELEGELPRIRYRLIGTGIRERYGEDFTGRYLDEVCGPHYRDLLQDIYGRMRDHARPIYLESLFRFAPDMIAKSCRLYLPLAQNGRITMALAGQTFPTYPFSQPDFFDMIRPAISGGHASHNEWLLDPPAEHVLRSTAA
ncbi:PAS domain-containing protein [Ferrovibrio sp.]|uniref:PAS domain-containing protein n=1 Tax=Ferrovibrio sp. TaxID=1917215 RepID=UPI00260F5CC9|nr:PAS domain-containing protein [Ferrovibrio sp.]